MIGPTRLSRYNVSQVDGSSESARSMSWTGMDGQGKREVLPTLPRTQARLLLSIDGRASISKQRIPQPPPPGCRATSTACVCPLQVSSPVPRETTYHEISKNRFACAQAHRRAPCWAHVRSQQTLLPQEKQSRAEGITGGLESYSRRESLLLWVFWSWFLSLVHFFSVFVVPRTHTSFGLRGRGIVGVQ